MSGIGLTIAIILHPRDGDEHLEELRGVVSRLRRRGHRVLPRLTFEEGDAARLAREAARVHADVVVAAGGDGTVNEVVNGLVRSRWQPRLAIAPLGTANDFASALDLPTRLDEALDVAIRGRPLAIDVGRVNNRSFINVSTGGFGAVTAESTPVETKRMLGPLAYLIAGVREFVEFRSAVATFLDARGRVIFAGEFLFFAVGNGPRTGGGSRVTPFARLDDGLLDLVVVPAMPRLDFLALLPDLRAGTHLGKAGIVYARAPTFTIRPTTSIAVNTDGEPLRARRLRYSIHPRPLTLMAP